MIQELYLQGGDEGLLPVHALHWLVPHGLLQVPLCEELIVHQLCNLLRIDPVLCLVRQVRGGHDQAGGQVVVVGVSG